MLDSFWTYAFLNHFDEYFLFVDIVPTDTVDADSHDLTPLIQRKQG